VGRDAFAVARSSAILLRRQLSIAYFCRRIRLMRRFHRSFLLAAIACVACACGNNAATDTGTTDDSTNQDATQSEGGLDSSPSDVMQTDTHRGRDVGGEVNLDSAGGNCFVMVTPTCGPATQTSVIDGSGLQPGVQYTLIISSPTGAGITRQMVTASASGTFSYMFSQAGLANGTYTVDINDPSFVCSFTAMFTIPCV
jgi:hypothetical protein